MLSRIKWLPILAIVAAVTAIILGVLGADLTITIPTALLGVTFALVAREN